MWEARGELRMSSRSMWVRNLPTMGMRRPGGVFLVVYIPYPCPGVLAVLRPVHL
jgi:hypothetical protein